MPIRRAAPDDARAIAANEARAAHAPWSASQIEATLEVPHALGWVADEQGVVGHLLSAVVAGEAELLTVGVDPAWRRRGLARALLDTATRGWAEAGATVAWLEVRRDNAPARALYAAAGWTEGGVRRAYYRDGTDALVLRLELPPAP